MCIRDWGKRGMNSRWGLLQQMLSTHCPCSLDFTYQCALDNFHVPVFPSPPEGCLQRTTLPSHRKPLVLGSSQSQEQPSTNDWQKWVYKCPGRLDSREGLSEACVLYQFLAFPQRDLVSHSGALCWLPFPLSLPHFPGCISHISPIISHVHQNPCLWVCFLDTPSQVSHLWACCLAYIIKLNPSNNWEQ